MLGSRVGRRLSEFRVQVFSSKKILLFDAAPVCLHRREGTRLGAVDMEGLPLSFPRVGPAAGWDRPVSLCVRSHMGQHRSHLGRTHPLLLRNQHLCVSFTRLRSHPGGEGALLPAHWPDGKSACHHCCHGHNSNISNVTVNFMALFLLEDLVRMQLLYNS